MQIPGILIKRTSDKNIKADSPLTIKFKAQVPKEFYLFLKIFHSI